MKVVLSARDQKELHYEVECILRMFLPQARIEFAQEGPPAPEETWILTGTGKGKENIVYLSQLSTATLKGRMENEGFE